MVRPDLHPMSKLDFVGVPNWTKGEIRTWGKVEYENTKLRTGTDIEPRTGSLPSELREGEVSF
jgi:hypothetical protein